MYGAWCGLQKGENGHTTACLLRPTTKGATMKPATPQAEPQPSIWFRKIVAGGSLIAQIQYAMRCPIRLVCHVPRFTSRDIPWLKQITVPRCFISVLVGASVLCGGCASPPQTPPVSPDAPVAQIEYSGFDIYKVAGVSAYLAKVDGVKVWTLKGSMKGAGWRGKWGDYANVFTLTPGVHTFEVTINQGSPLTIELNARAGHNYRLCAGNYDKMTTSLYIEDVATGEVVSGHRPDNMGVEPRRSDRKW